MRNRHFYRDTKGYKALSLKSPLRASTMNKEKTIPNIIVKI